MEQRSDRLCCQLYDGNLNAQEEITRVQLRKMLAVNVPPVLMYLHANHFNALVPDELVCDEACNEFQVIDSD